MTFIPKNDQGVSYIQPSYNYRDDRPTAPKRRSPRLKSSANRLSSSAITFSVSMTAAVAASRIWRGRSAGRRSYLPVRHAD
jgi:hypothetical protein